MRRLTIGAVVVCGVLAALVVAVVLIGGSGGPAFRQADPATVADYDYVIPAGTGLRIDQGLDVDVIPEQLTVHVGETIRIVNDDDRGHLAGPFFVGAGQTLRQTFSRAGELVGECSTHPSGQFVLRIQP